MCGDQIQHWLISHNTGSRPASLRRVLNARICRESDVRVGPDIAVPHLGRNARQSQVAVARAAIGDSTVVATESLDDRADRLPHHDQSVDAGSGVRLEVETLLFGREGPRSQPPSSGPLFV